MHARVRLSFFRFNTSFSIQHLIACPSTLTVVQQFRNTIFSFMLYPWKSHHLNSEHINNRQKEKTHIFVPLYKSSGNNRPTVLQAVVKKSRKLCAIPRVKLTKIPVKFHGSRSAPTLRTSLVHDLC